MRHFLFSATHLRNIRTANREAAESFLGGGLALGAFQELKRLVVFHDLTFSEAGIKWSTPLDINTMLSQRGLYRDPIDP